MECACGAEGESAQMEQPPWEMHAEVRAAQMARNDPR
jgi:hypothetical protein